MTQIIGGFVDRHYPKGDSNRGFALTVLAIFLLQLAEKDSKYTLIKKIDAK